MNRERGGYLFAVAGILLLLVPGAAAIYAQTAFNPATTAQESDAVVWGAVTSVDAAGDPTIDVIDVFKGEDRDSLTVMTQNKVGKSVSTSATFSEGEEVIVMLQKQGRTDYMPGRYTMTSGYASKYEVANDTVQLISPERKRITVQQMKEIVQTPETVNVSNLTVPDVSDDEKLPNSNAVQDASDTAEPTGAVSTQTGFLNQLWQTFTDFFL